jgi:uncharacterized membrane protein YcaP (DUF421 family)
METVARAVIMYLFLALVMRAIGRKELSGLSAFELVLLVVMGDLIQQGVTQNDMSITGAMLAIGTFAVLVVGLSWVSFKWKRLRPIVEGIPVIVIRNGKPLPKVLTMERLTEDDLKDAAREQGIGDLGEVAVGVLEPDGRYSFIKSNGSGDDQLGENQETQIS